MPNPQYKIILTMQDQGQNTQDKTERRNILYLVFVNMDDPLHPRKSYGGDFQIILKRVEASIIYVVSRVAPISTK